MPGWLVWVLPLNYFAYNTDALSEHNGIILMSRVVSFSQTMQWERLLSSCFPAVSQLLASKESTSVSSLSYWWGAEAMEHKGTCWRSSGWPGTQTQGDCLHSLCFYFLYQKKRKKNSQISIKAWLPAGCFCSILCLVDMVSTHEHTCLPMKHVQCRAWNQWSTSGVHF